MPARADWDHERQPDGGELRQPEVRLAPHRLRLLAFLVDVLFFLVLVGLGFVAGKFYDWLAWLLRIAAAITFVDYVAATVWLMDRAGRWRLVAYGGCPGYAGTPATARSRARPPVARLLDLPQPARAGLNHQQ